MGGGPRTFPGGLNKWQWKRLHEKQARDKEKRLLDQEKQLYEARVRSEIRSKLTHDPDGTSSPNGQNFKPLSPKEHVKSLADRFMKPGAEDLWNEDDGPVEASDVREMRRIEASHRPVNVRGLLSGQNRRGFSVCSLGNVRCYSGRAMRFNKRGNDSDESDSSADEEMGFLAMKTKGGDMRVPRLSLVGLSGDEEEGEGKGNGNGRGKKMMMSSAALGKYDIKTKRIPLQMVEQEDDVSLHVQAIRNELNKRKMAEIENEAGDDDDTILSTKRFDECDVSPLTIKALTLAGYVQMTKVQDATITTCLEGKDALVKAKTGTGKSAAFLLPAIETVLKASASNAAKRISPICVLILCPTRELASQIAAEANVLLKYHEGIGVQTLVGGTRFKVDQQRLETELCQIIVATPGRLLDHIENKSGFSARLMKLKMLILDEADHLLDLGFRKDMEKIVDCLPRQRQSLLFTSTLPKEVRRVSQLVLKREHAYINTVGLGPETHDKVNQSLLIAPHEQHFQIVHHLLKDHIAQVPDYKVILFCTTAMMTSLMYSLFREMRMNVREIHSRKPPLYRTRVSEEFKEAKKLILVTSDVSARGMNYPDVSLVIQVGVPTDREQYINRLGRTGREGKGGEGILLLAPWEEYFLQEIKDLPIHKLSSPHLDPDMKVKVEKSMAKIDPSVKEAAYHAWLGYYNSIREIGRDKTTLVELGKEAQVGVCYGLLGNNLPTPAQVISLYKSQNIKRMRIYDPNQDVLQALKGSNIELMIGVPNSDLAYVAASRDNAFDWVWKNVASLPDVKFRYIAVGNEVKPSDSTLAPLVHPALTNIHEVISVYGLKDQIKVSTSVDTTLIGVSYPPSQGAFRDDAMSYLNPIIGFLVAINAPLLVNVYPYFSYAGNPTDISVAYATFTSPGTVVQDGANGYQNLFDAIVDSTYSAIEIENEAGDDDDTILSTKRFDECDVSPLTIKALTLAGYVQMTKVQDATITTCLEGKDALVKAKTGTGKSAAFLLPAIETVLKASASNAAKWISPICVLILCPTRELASQIAAEANVLLKYHEGIGVQTLVGGTRFKVDQQRLETELCQIIVATPGRLLDHIENKSGFSARLMKLKMLILDEADHLLDLGFRKDMEKIVDCLPRQRQSLLFTSTLPKEVRRVSQLVLKREHAYINTVGLGPETHDKVNQSLLIAPHEQHFQIVHRLLKDHIAQVPDYKVILFCTTAMMTSLMYSLFREMRMNVREIHSRKPPLYRTRVSEEFKEAKRLILITSDVSARGMNYPDVSLVIQVGVPTDREQYINRLGRTGREGKGGEGILLLAPWEEYFLQEIKDLPIHKLSSPHLDPDMKVKVEKSMAKIDPSVKEAAYHAWLGYYNSIREIGRDKTTLVELGKGFCDSIGLEKVPALFRKTAVKMGLKDIAGIRVRK
ncbi:DNA/RNA helicase, DEAD/DEAH box type, N-terminal [Artemisia annua]|uniref:ATP-dependent RNA helicase n=1 Tax=Artemisia annua TaxID=35608 RepID=A0A2U1N383_ARTAN|nr:DNA/RNA helicase, DEAD/DEAH box type, N-terminal [Artemisia annua]